MYTAVCFKVMRSIYRIYSVSIAYIETPVPPCAQHHPQQQPMPAAPLRSAAAPGGRGSIALVALRERVVT